ncbi:hypothetical protein GOBAR_DD09205 [Gossypium barbadense]|nr:hypothetical protein GOBAR_DD09205 [Gossypium barbadense]
MATAELGKRRTTCEVGRGALRGRGSLRVRWRQTSGPLRTIRPVYPGRPAVSCHGTRHSEVRTSNCDRWRVAIRGDNIEVRQGRTCGCRFVLGRQIGVRQEEGSHVERNARRIVLSILGRQHARTFRKLDLTVLRCLATSGAETHVRQAFGRRTRVRLGHSVDKRHRRATTSELEKDNVTVGLIATAGPCRVRQGDRCRFFIPSAHIEVRKMRQHRSQKVSDATCSHSKRNTPKLENERADTKKL